MKLDEIVSSELSLKLAPFVRDKNSFLRFNADVLAALFVPKATPPPLLAIP
jgi:hypothetical protein